MKSRHIIFACLVAIISLVPGASKALSEQPSDTDTTVAICHEGQTYFIDESELQEHLDHGDTQGACDDDSRTSDESENDEGEKQEKVTICHKGKQTISVAQAAVQAHLDHGDTLGACPDSSDSTVGRQQPDQDEPEQQQTKEQTKNKDSQKEKEKTSEKEKQGNGKDKGKANDKGKGKS